MTDNDILNLMEAEKTACKYIQQAIAKHRKKALGAKNKVQIEDGSIYEPLEDYESPEAISESYGNGYITMEEYDRLRDLWDAREKVEKKGGIYTDKVIELLERVQFRLLTAEESEAVIDYRDAQAKKSVAEKALARERKWKKK